MSGARSLRAASMVAVALAVALVPLAHVSRAWGAQGSEVAWRLEQPAPPSPATPGVQGSSVPIGLGKIGDIEFWAPNHGLLITAGNPPTIPPGLWVYNGQQWHELATECGATDGRIAWAGPDEFWTVSDGRRGQVAGGSGLVPLEDNTLCRFAGGQVVASYAHPAAEADSYQAMQAAGCIAPSDCWFAGNPLPEPQIGAFQLHWNGGALQAEPYPTEGHAIEDMRLYEGHLYESVRVLSEDRLAGAPPVEVPLIHRINPEGVRPTFEPELGLPVAGSEGPNPVDFLHLSTPQDAQEAQATQGAQSALWAAAGPGPEGGQITVLRRAGGTWSQILGPLTEPSGAQLFPLEAVEGIAAEPSTESAWLALDSSTDARQPSPATRALVARIAAAGAISEAQTLPAGGGGAKGAAAKITCPAVNDCWLATTQGWLFHLAPADERTLPKDEDPNFAGLITYRPPDQGLPQLPPDAPPVDNSGLGEEPPPYGTVLPEPPKSEAQARVAVSLLSHLHSRLVHGTTLELRFHLAARARVRLIAKRHKLVVASTPTRTLKAGNRSLLLRLNRHRWPTKLDMQTHALAKLPTVAAAGGGSNTVSTGLVVLPHTLPFAGSEPLL
jgi:hypothetical protein